ncbi:MAG: SIS domain-containing protein [Alphaproteobacteria bacterium]|nr:SIS domain-containing protein [Alphaproteobacteria bacterium]
MPAVNPVVTEALQEARTALDALLTNEAALRSIGEAGRLLAACFGRGNRVYSCGNGGSMCDAMHFAEELSGRFRLDRPALPATAIGDAGHLTCVANDYGFDHIFSRYVEAHGRAGDCLLAISTSGASSNIAKAAEAARAAGLSVIALTGRSDSALGALADIDICTPVGRFSDRVQELHIKVVHILIELVERELYPENYRD